MSCGPGMSQSSTVECKTLHPVGMVCISLWLLSLLAWHTPLYCARQTGESETIVRVFLYLTFWQPLINTTTFLFACWEKELFSSTLLKCSPFRLTEVQLFAVASCCWYFLEEPNLNSEILSVVLISVRQQRKAYQTLLQVPLHRVAS